MQAKPVECEHYFRLIQAGGWRVCQVNRRSDIVKTAEWEILKWSNLKTEYFLLFENWRLSIKPEHQDFFTTYEGYNSEDSPMLYAPTLWWYL